jgi:hypothetical protein
MLDATPRPAEREIAGHEGCRRGDLNPHALAGTSPQVNRGTSLISTFV